MYLNHNASDSEEDEKSAVDPFAYDEQLPVMTRRIFEQRREELLKVYSNSFIDHVLESLKFTGVSHKTLILTLCI